MSIPKIPGIEKYPFLQSQLSVEWNKLSTGCPKCHRNRLIRKYRELVRREDKSQGYVK